jgi:hypothetical protein
MSDLASVADFGGHGEMSQKCQLRKQSIDAVVCARMTSYSERPAFRRALIPLALGIFAALDFDR